MRYRVKYEFLCNDHRLRGTVEKEMDESEIKGRSNDQIAGALAPTILAKYPYIADSVDYLETISLTVNPAS